MKIKNKQIIIVLFNLLLILLSACESPPALPGDLLGESRSVSITSPEDNSEWTVGTPISIRSSVSAPEVVIGLTLFINGQQERAEDLFAHPTFTRGTIHQIWTPDQPGVFNLQTILRDGGGFAESNIVTISVGEATKPIITEITPSIITPTITSTEITLTPTQTLTPTLTLTPETGKPEATANQNLNCRRGPSTEYESLWYFMQGETTSIEGRNTDSSWLVISRTDGGGQCWVASYYVQIEGELSTLPFITPPPLPVTHTPTITPTRTATVTEIPYSSCSDYPDFSTCTQDPMGFGGCSWSTGLNVCEGP